MANKKPEHKVHITYMETEELRNLSIENLEIPDSCMNVLNRIEARTIGDVLDNWNNLEQLPGCGVVKLRHIRAATFALMCEMGCLKNCELKEVV